MSTNTEFLDISFNSVHSWNRLYGLSFTSWCKNGRTQTTLRNVGPEDVGEDGWGDETEGRYPVNNQCQQDKQLPKPANPSPLVAH